MIPLLAGPYVTELSESTERWFVIGDLLIWAAFAIDLGARTWLAERRIQFLLDHRIEVLVVLIPFLRPLRVIMVLFRTSEILRRRAASGALVGAGFAIVVVTLIVADAERNGSGAIDDLGTAFWWALATITTVGYGDVVPVTTVGRVAGTFLMFVGIGVFGVLTANVAAWFVEEADTQGELMAEVRSLRDEVRELRAQLEVRRTTGD